MRILSLKLHYLSPFVSLNCVGDVWRLQTTHHTLHLFPGYLTPLQPSTLIIYQLTVTFPSLSLESSLSLTLLLIYLLPQTLSLPCIPRFTPLNSLLPLNLANLFLYVTLLNYLYVYTLCLNFISPTVPLFLPPCDFKQFISVFLTPYILLYLLCLCLTPPFSAFAATQDLHSGLCTVMISLLCPSTSAAHLPWPLRTQPGHRALPSISPSFTQADRSVHI